MTDTQQTIQAIAELIADYRNGEIPRPDAAHVQRWINQFDEKVRGALLGEVHHVLKRTYVSKAEIEKFLTGLVGSEKFAGTEPKTFWQNAKFLNIQQRGRSQGELLKLFAVALAQKTGLDIEKCGLQPACFIYLDDGIFTGMTLIQSLKAWLEKAAPQKAVLHVVVIAGHLGGKYYAETQLQQAARKIGKEIEFRWWAQHTIEDRRSETDKSDVLRPTKLPDDQRTQAYAKALKYPVVFRKPGSVGSLGVFSSDEGRILLEEQMLMKGTLIREQSPQLPKYARPLGDMVLETLGFGSTFVTFRNCPNNAPLAFWAGDPWHPLFPRKTN